MTTNLNPDGYAVVYYDGDTPKICKGMNKGVKIDGTTYAVYDSAQEAMEEFARWPHTIYGYGIIPMRLLVEERPRYVLKDSALDA